MRTKTRKVAKGQERGNMSPWLIDFDSRGNFHFPEIEFDEYDWGGYSTFSSHVENLFATAVYFKVGVCLSARALVAILGQEKSK